MRAILVAVTLLAGAARAGADDGGAIAVLPLTSSEKRLAMYGVPVARVLAGQLRGTAGAPVETVTGTGSLPRRVAWVIDGRIVAVGGKVVLEARVRDPGRGRAFGQVASRPGKLTEIDQLARQIAGDLVPLLVKARESRKVAPAAVKHPSTPTIRSTKSERPAVVITRDREPIVTDAVAALVERLGYRVVVGDLVGVAPPAAVQTALQKAGAAFALLAQVKSVDYEWQRGVLTARGKIRLVLVGRSGEALYNADLDTDTLVGSRGDRHAALLGFVARQVMQMATPVLRKAIAR
jgi:hypothetical protein